MKKALLLLLVVLIAIGGTYAFFAWRKDKLFKEKSTDGLLTIDNSSPDDLLLLMNSDTIAVNAWSTVFYPIKKPADKESVHLVSINKKTRKVLADTTWSPGDSIGDYVINAGLSRYVNWDVEYISTLNLALNPPQYHGDNVVHELPVYHGYDTLHLVGNLLTDEPISYLSGFIIRSSDYETLFSSEVARSIESYAFSGSITKHYLLSEEDFIENYMRIRHVREMQGTISLMTYLIGTTCERTRKTDPAFHADARRFLRPPLGYFYVKDDLDEFVRDFNRVPQFRKDSSSGKVNELIEFIDRAYYHDTVPNPYFVRHPRQVVSFTESWSGFFDPEMSLERFERTR